MSTFIRQLSEVGAEDVASVGGKGASLGELMKMGMPVPQGFVLCAEAYEQGELTDEMRAEVLGAFDQLGADRVAVRSSATCEDGKVASWAGELETYLNIDREQLIDRVLACWSSLASPRAQAYREEQGLNEARIAVAVVIQQMVPAEAAGVIFTTHPITGNQNQIVIEAAPGLGDAVVGGEVIPDTYVVEKETGEVVYDSDEALLKVDEIATLLEFACAIEEHFGFPCDIEWAMAHGEMFILQSRPITTLYG